MANRKDVPKYDSLMKPTVEALKALGGSASNEELHDSLTLRDAHVCQMEHSAGRPSPRLRAS